MKVQELIKLLQKADPNAIVVLSIDEEGNGYQELYQIDYDKVYKDGEIGYRKITPELRKKDIQKQTKFKGERSVLYYGHDWTRTISTFTKDF